MADVSPSGYTRSEPAADDERWWTTGYAVRLAIAMVIAGAVVGAIVGPSGLLFGQLRAAWSGSVLTFPLWMYGQAAAMHAALGVLIGGGGSIVMVLMLPRPSTRRALLLRICAGPILAGGLMIVLALFWGGSGVPQQLVTTAFGCAVFVFAGMLSRTARWEPPVDA